jgi:hypothetical protein
MGSHFLTRRQQHTQRFSIASSLAEGESIISKWRDIIAT